MHGTAVVLALAGEIWVLVLAFQEKLQQGLLCLLVPCYQLYYIFSRWEETRGAFILQMLPAANMVVAAARSRSVWAMYGATNAGLPQSPRPGLHFQLPPRPGPRRRKGPTASRFKVEEAEATFRDYIKSIDNLTYQIVNAQRPGSNFATIHTLMRSINVVEMMEKRTQYVHLNRLEWTALKHRVGQPLRASLGAFKSEMLRIEAQPDMRGVFEDAPELLDREIAFWTIQPGEEVRPGWTTGRRCRWGRCRSREVRRRVSECRAAEALADLANPDAGRPRTPITSSRSLAPEHGERAVTIMFSGIPGNSDPSRGVTARDVSEALRKRLQELAPAATNFMWMSKDGKSALVLSPVDDVAGLARRIDFGTAAATGKQIDVDLSSEYVASVPRCPRSNRRLPPSEIGQHRQADAEFPPGTDAVTRWLIQLKSPGCGKKKEGIDRLERTPPDLRLAEVVAAVVPLLEDDDGWLVTDAIKVLAIWKSADAVPPLIRRIGDNRGSVRQEAMKGAGEIKDSGNVEPIIAQDSRKRWSGRGSIKEMGPVAEQALIERLANPDSGVRRRACEILKFVGGKATLKAMQAIPLIPTSAFGSPRMRRLRPLCTAWDHFPLRGARARPRPGRLPARGRNLEQILIQSSFLQGEPGSRRLMTARATSAAIEPAVPLSRAQCK